MTSPSHTLASTYEDYGKPVDLSGCARLFKVLGAARMSGFFVSCEIIENL